MNKDPEWGKSNEYLDWLEFLTLYVLVNAGGFAYNV